ncbi:LIM domain only protein 7b [Austrofundulus limnaeus]|uniref:LIM domain only protein 7b n=1 Tax=Austrofundulus limnaeus TaxID=52670 RepID=A0A2I4ASN2_AUSLI|nr:PREDICTED: LIM domain only protein 7-like [Austrofundulus limnaeus]
MEWRRQSSLSCADAFIEAQRWIQEVTGKSFGCSDFRAALENGVLLCDLINQLKPGIIKRVNRLSTPIAGLDNVNVFLKACGKLGLNESQLFHPGDLQDLSTRVTLRRDESQRRVKNVLVTVYWLGRKAQLDPFYSGPQLNFKAFEGLLGLALSKALEDGSNVCVKDGGYKESRSSEEDLCQDGRQTSVGGNSEDCFESLDTRALRPHDEACGSDAEAEQVFRMDSPRLSAHQSKGSIPPSLRRKQGREENPGAAASPLPRSKSLSDIPMVYPARKVSNGNPIYNKGQDTGLLRGWSQESERKRSIAAKDSEAQWQDVLTKWKNRRRSTKTELYRKSQDREHVIIQVADGAALSYEAQGGPIKRFSRDQSPWQHSTAPRFSSNPSPSKPSSSDLRPHTRALLAHSCATEDPVGSKTHTQGSAVGAMQTSAGIIFEEEKTNFAFLASDGARVTTPSLDHPFTSQTQVRAFSSQAPPDPAQPQNAPTDKGSLVASENPNKFLQSTSSLNPASSGPRQEKPPVNINLKEMNFSSNPVNEAGADTTKLLPDSIRKAQEESRKLDWGSSVDRRNQQASGNSKYTSRTVSWSSSASLPRGFRRSEGSSRISAAVTARPFGIKQSRMSSVPRRYSADNNQVLLLSSEKEDSPLASPKSSIRRQTAAANLRDQYQASVRQKKSSQARRDGAEQRQEVPESSTQTQILPQPHPNLQTYHNKSWSLPSKAGSDYSKVDHSDMRVSLTLKPNSVPDFGFQTLWDSTGLRVKFIQPASPAEHCQLRVDDEIVAVDGVSVAHLTSGQWKNKMASSLQTGSLTMDVRRYGIKGKYWSNSKESHPTRPGQNRMTLNLTSTAPVLMGYPDHHNSVASTDTQTSKSDWQKENITQEAMDGVVSESSALTRSKEYCSVTRQNQKRREDFFSEKGAAGISSWVYLCGGSESAISDIQVPALSPSACSWSWDREEDRRRQEKWQEEQERLLQEQYQRDQERLEAEWRQAQQDAAEGRKLQENTQEVTSGPESLSSGIYMNGLMKKTPADEQRPGEDLKEVVIKQSDAHRPLTDRMTENDWAEGSSGFTRLSPAHRALSSSTPSLSGPYKQPKGDQRRRLGRSMSKAERDRQQILEEMKKRTQLLTDNSWIRQRSNSFHKEPIDVGASINRYDSLDNLDTLSSNLAATFSYPRPHSAAGGYVVPSRNAASRYSTGSIQRNDSPHYASVWAATDILEEQRLESRSMSGTGSPIVSTAISNSSPQVPCDQHDVLQIEE